MDSKSSKLLGKIKNISRTLVETYQKDHAEKISQIADSTKKTLTEISSNLPEYKQKLAQESSEIVKGNIDTVKRLFDSIEIKIKNSEDDLGQLEKDILSQGGYYRELCREIPLIDRALIGGESLAIYFIDSTYSAPENIEKAYAAAYPAESENVSFADKVREMQSDAELAGLVSGVKGKLFEQQYVEYLNSGQLPEGFTAELASKANQPGWDIQIVGNDNEVVQFLQAKATNSVSYVEQALEKYPQIDVVTTDEVFSQLILEGASDRIIDSGISEVGLTEFIESSASNVEVGMNLAPPVLALAFIAYTSYKPNKNDSGQSRSYEFSERATVSYLSYLVGGSFSVIAQTWWIGAFISIASHYKANQQLMKIKMAEQLRKTKADNQKVIDNLVKVQKSKFC